MHVLALLSLHLIDIYSAFPLLMFLSLSNNEIFMLDHRFSGSNCCCPVFPAHTRRVEGDRVEASQRCPDFIQRGSTHFPLILQLLLDIDELHSLESVKLRQG